MTCVKHRSHILSVLSVLPRIVCAYDDIRGGTHLDRVGSGRGHVRCQACARPAAHVLGQREGSGDRMRPACGIVANLGARRRSAEKDRGGCRTDRQQVRVRLPVAFDGIDVRARAYSRIRCDAYTTYTSVSFHHCGATRERRSRKVFYQAPRGRSATVVLAFGQTSRVDRALANQPIMNRLLGFAGP